MGWARDWIGSIDRPIHTHTLTESHTACVRVSLNGSGQSPRLGGMPGSVISTISRSTLSRSDPTHRTPYIHPGKAGMAAPPPTAAAAVSTEQQQQEGKEEVGDVSAVLRRLEAGSVDAQQLIKQARVSHVCGGGGAVVVVQGCGPLTRVRTHSNTHTPIHNPHIIPK